MASSPAVTAVMEGYRPLFRNSGDKVAFAVNGVFLVSGFILHDIGASAASKWNTDFEPCLMDEIDIHKWNELEEGRYFFIYYHRWIHTIKIFVQMVSRDGKLHICVQDVKEGSHPTQTQLDIEIARYLPVNENEPIDSYYRNYRNWDELVTYVEKEIVDPYNPYPPEPDQSLREKRRKAPKNTRRRRLVTMRVFQKHSKHVPMPSNNRYALTKQAAKQKLVSSMRELSICELDDKHLVKVTLPIPCSTALEPETKQAGLSSSICELDDKQLLKAN